MIEHIKKLIIKLQTIVNTSEEKTIEDINTKMEILESKSMTGEDRDEWKRLWKKKVGSGLDSAGNRRDLFVPEPEWIIENKRLQTKVNKPSLSNPNFKVVVDENGNTLLVKRDLCGYPIDPDNPDAEKLANIWEMIGNMDKKLKEIKDE